MISRAGLMFAVAVTVQGGQIAVAETSIASNSPSQDAHLDEIIVTAQKRQENVQDVPSSVSVLSGSQLQELGAAQLSDYAGYLPGFTVEGGGAPGAARLSLRGIESNTSSTVATYIDDSPLGSSSSYGDRGSLSLDLFPYDVEHVEVLRGPQGTLYGANSMGGLLKYQTVWPSLTDFSARVGADVFGVHGADGTGWNVRAAGDIPLIQDQLGLRASYYRQDNPGFINDVVTNQKGVNSGVQQGGRLALLWQPTADFNVKVSTLQQDLNYDGLAAIAASLPNLTPTLGLANTNLLASPYHQRMSFYDAIIDWKIAGLDLTSATSYSRTKTDVGTGFTGLLSSLGILGLIGETNFLEKTTEELRLASPTGGTVEWMIGSFYTNEEYNFMQTATALTTTGVPVAAFNPLLGAVQPSVYREYAEFGNVTYRFNEQFDISGGLRWSHDEQTFGQTNTGFLFNPGDPTSTTVISTSGSESVTNYMVTASYHFVPDSMLYARVASGYRPGGPNIAFPGVQDTFGSDKLTNYELGIKSEFMDRRALVDADVFYIDWRNIQVSLNTPTLIPYLVNAGSAVSKGVEFTSNFKPVGGLSLGLNFAYTDATVSDTITGLGAVAGDRIPYVARVSGSVLASYAFPVVAGLEGTLNLGDRYSGDRYSTFNSNPAAIRLPSYSAIDASLGVGKDHWKARLYARNLNDARGYQTDLGPAGGGLENVAIIQPRTVGLAVDLSY
jgi:iron complex outermembrane receptor protein